MQKILFTIDLINILLIVIIICVSAGAIAFTAEYCYTRFLGIYDKYLSYKEEKEYAVQEHTP